ncbi:hypothetical protein ACFQI7_37390 [Paenibacillus allorhizosphaerae]|uniref:hypothetical protein n=1 Tax=Paenibacillus allorhizosphaerae TaxID=2849866 RepID=UPI001C4055B7|nr:hypothetical protein [Paenibacillus allorhizosphaerae]
MGEEYRRRIRSDLTFMNERLRTELWQSFEVACFSVQGVQLRDASSGGGRRHRAAVYDPGGHQYRCGPAGVPDQCRRAVHDGRRLDRDDMQVSLRKFFAESMNRSPVSFAYKVEEVRKVT